MLPVVDHAAVVAGQERGARVLRGLQAHRAHAGVEPLPGPETLGSTHHSAGTAGWVQWAEPLSEFILTPEQYSRVVR